MRAFAVIAILPLCTALRFAPITPKAPLRCSSPIASAAEPPEDETEEQRRQRLEKLGREAAEELTTLDSAADDGGLMAEFNARLNQEGGANVFKLKTGAAAVTETANEAAQAAKDKAAGIADAASSVTSGLNEQQKNVGKIILGIIAFNLLIGAIGLLSLSSCLHPLA